MWPRCTGPGSNPCTRARRRRPRGALPGAHDPAHTHRGLADRPRSPKARRIRGRMTAAISIEGVHKSFGKVMVLQGVDVEVPESKAVCLIGASGSGKSTLLRCVNLLEPVDSGRILVHGDDITARNVDANRVRRRIGIVFQAF